MFSLLSDDDKLKKRALKEHRKLERLFQDSEDINRALSLIEEQLEEHIRFEERILFNQIQKIATESELAKMEEIHQEQTGCISFPCCQRATGNQNPAAHCPRYRCKIPRTCKK